MQWGGGVKKEEESMLRVGHTGRELRTERIQRAQGSNTGHNNLLRITWMRLVLSDVGYAWHWALSGRCIIAQPYFGGISTGTSLQGRIQ